MRGAKPALDHITQYILIIMLHYLALSHNFILTLYGGVKFACNFVCSFLFLWCGRFVTHRYDMKAIVTFIRISIINAVFSEIFYRN